MENVNYQQLYENLLKRHDTMREEHFKQMSDHHRRTEEIQYHTMAKTLAISGEHTTEVAKLRLALEILDRMELPVEAQAVVQASLDRKKTC